LWQSSLTTKGTTMTKKDEVVFDKAFAKMEAKGYFTELRAKVKQKAKPKTKPRAKVVKKTRRQVVAASASSSRSALSVPLAANKR